MAIVSQVELKVGQKYWIIFGGEPRRCRIVGVYEQNGRSIVEFTAARSWFDSLLASSKVELAQDFLKRML